MDKSIVFSVENIGSEETIKKLAELKLVFKQLTKDIADANKADNKKLFSELTVAQEKVKVAIQDTTKELKEQKKEFENSKYPTGSLKSLQAEYEKTATSIRKLSAAQRESAGGQKLIETAKGIKDHINSVSQSFGDTSKNIGNYANDISKAIQSPLEFIKGAGTVGAIIGIGTAAIEGSKQFIEAFDQAQLAATRLVIALDGDKKAAKEFESDAQKLSQITLFDKTSIEDAQSYLLTLGFTKKEVKDLVPHILDYAEATGTELHTAVTKVGQSILGTAAESDKLNVSFGETKDQAGRTKIAVDNLSKSVGGQAQAAADASSGGLKQLAKSWNDIEETIGGFLLRLVNKFIPSLSNGTNGFSKLVVEIVASVAGAIEFFRASISDVVIGVKGAVNNIEQVYYKAKSLLGDKQAGIKLNLLKIEDNELAKKIIDPVKAAYRAANAERDAQQSLIDNVKVNGGTNSGKNNKIDTTKAKKEKDDSANLEKERLLKILEALKDGLTEKDKIELTNIEQREKREKDFIDRHIELIKKGQVTEKELILAFNKEKIKISQDEAARRETDNISILPELRTKKIGSLSESEVNAKKDADIRIKHLKSIQDAQDKINKDNKDAQDQRDQDRKDQIKQSIKDSEVEAISGIDNLLQIQLDKEQAAADKIKNARLSSLSDEYTKKKAYAQGNSELLIKLNQEEAEKRAKIEKEEAKKSQQIAIKRALIDGAAAILKTFATLGFPAGLFASIPLAVATGLQIAAIKSQKFDKGGFTGIGSNRIDSSGKRVAGVVHANEYVAPDDQIVRYPNLFHWLNDERINKGVSPSFEVGGFTSPLKKIPSIMQVLSPTRFDRALSVPQVIVKFPEQTKRDTEKQFAYFNDEQIAFQTKQLYNASLEGSKRGTAEGLQEANRRILREQILKRKLTS